jgi:hypothetical protein
MTKVKCKKKKDPKKYQPKGTLDQKHTEVLNRFDQMSKSLPAKKKKLKKLELELSGLLSMNPNKFSNEDIRRKSSLMDSIEKLKIEIKSIENCTESLDYIVGTLPILIDYYDNKDILEDDVGEEAVGSMGDNPTGRKSVLTYFVQVTNETMPIYDAPTQKKKRGRKPKVTAPLPPPPLKRANSKVSKAKLYDNYLTVVDVTHRRTSKHTMACDVPECDGKKILGQNDGYLVCNKCGASEKFLSATEKPNYKEPTQDSGTYAYKRINHLTEILSQLQAKESTDIPPKVFETILKELKKRKINKNDLDLFRLRRILKKLNLRKYYEHVPHMLQIINGKEPPNFSRRDEVRIKKMFKDIQKPFEIYCPSDRKNFLNYAYVLHKFCELLGLDEYISYFPLLKNNSKLRQHDKIWKNICGYMRWKFYKSI